MGFDAIIAKGRESMAKRERHQKTNAMREVETSGFDFDVHTFDCDGARSGIEVARILGEDPDRVFKTLVTQAKSGEHYVFMIPVALELDLKRAASSVGEKAVHMIPSRDLLPLTGYVHGGCSPIGMKKPFVTTIDETAQLFDTIYFSAGRIGAQIEMDPDDLVTMIGAHYAALTA